MRNLPKAPSLTVHQPDRWPFPIELRDPDGNVVQTAHRSAYSSDDKTLDDVMTGRNQSPKWRDHAIVSNRKQLAAAYLEAAGPDLLEAAEMALALIKATWPEEHGQRAVGETWGALEQCIAKAKGGAS